MSMVHENISKDDCIEHLKEKGDFLVRKSQKQPQNLVLSVRGQRERIHHFTIETDKGQFFFKDGSEKFNTLDSLLDFYSCGKLTVHKQNVELNRNIPVKQLTIKGRWYYPDLSVHDAETRIEMLKPGYFLVRKSTISSNCFVITAKEEEGSTKHIEINEKKGKFSIGNISKDKFSSLDALIEYYTTEDVCLRTKEVDIFTNNPSNIFLRTPVKNTKFAISEIDNRIAELSQRIKESPFIDKKVGNKPRDGFWVEFEFITKFQLMLNSKQLLPCKEAKKYPAKNRFQNILPPDWSRVVLNDDLKEEYGDYINANYIQIRGFDIPYIATQGPKDDYILDMWRLIWQENIRIIIMTAQEIEKEVKKVAGYFPKVGRERLAFGPFKLEYVDGKADEEIVYCEIKVTYKGETRILHHYNFIAWPDFGEVTQSEVLVHLLQNVEKKKKQIEREKRIKFPLMIHCSAGVGRTGTTIAIDIIMKMMKRAKDPANEFLDIYDLTENLRSQRLNMIQTAVQYKMIYSAASIYKKMLNIK